MPPPAIAIEGGGLCERKELFFKRPLPFFTLLPIIDPMINIMPELTPVFTAYEALVAEADAVFARVGEMHPRFSGEKGIWHRIQRRSSSEVAWSRSRNGWRKRKLRSFMIETCGLFGGFEPESFNLGNGL